MQQLDMENLIHRSLSEPGVIFIGKEILPVPDKEPKAELIAEAQGKRIRFMICFQSHLYFLERRWISHARLLDLLDNHGESVRADFPDFFVSYLTIFMSKNIAQADNGRPWNIGMAVARVDRDVPGRFSNDLEVTFHRVACSSILHEIPKAHAPREFDNRPRGIQHIPQSRHVFGVMRHK